ncbi:Plasmid stabilization system protein ParE [Lishizhenia tianjinensis]|uniref:Plasmid stabilization system protein ParE n=1 Tax=Lishizhenia tianjinensis TaxID=477690 RepID=A0A1I6YUN4_9FLAO|nr:type II toxin-antitoxin system RelE/ParE family toxin [Lishizhenia tianjinensis]SFT53988.1 Plasmid stabilization system protein ParE [Lishizhenia tianjinensis]
MKTYLSELAESQLLDLLDYLIYKWGVKVRDNFLTKLDLKIKQISKHPYSCPESKEFGNLFKCVVTKQTTFFYRVDKEQEEIEIITVFDTRRDPENRNLVE